MKFTIAREVNRGQHGLDVPMMRVLIANEAHMNELNSVEAFRMFSILADTLDRKRDRKSVSERVMEMVAELHEQGFAVVKVAEPNPNPTVRRDFDRMEEAVDG